MENPNVDMLWDPCILSFVERLSSFRGYFVQSLYTMVHLVCLLFRGLSSFRVSFIGGFTVQVWDIIVQSLQGQIQEFSREWGGSCSTPPPPLKI